MKVSLDKIEQTFLASCWHAHSNCAYTQKHINDLPRQDALYKIIVTFFILLASQASFGNETAQPPKQAPEFTPYKASYEATWKAGWFPITVDASRELSKLDNGLWQLTFEAYSSVADLHEESQYSIDGNTVKPHYYRYKTSGFLSKKRRAQTFDWDRKQVWIPERDEWAKYELMLGIQDNLSYQEQIRLDLLAGKTDFSYSVAYKNRLKQYDFKVAKYGKTKTKQGLINTVEVIQEKESSKESTRIWFAVDYEYLLIKLQTKQKNGDSNTISLKKAIIQDNVLLGF
jgi:hypothetical protein